MWGTKGTVPPPMRPPAKLSGLQKWMLTNGSWQLAYVLQNGLISVSNTASPTSLPPLNPATDGFRNIAGKINGDGTVTIFGITSTVSANGDKGADPNRAGGDQRCHRQHLGHDRRIERAVHHLANRERRRSVSAV